MYVASEIFFTALEGLLVFIAFSVFSNYKEFIFKNYIKLLTFVFMYTIYTYWITLFIPTGLHSILICFFTVLTLNFAFNGTALKSFVKNFFIFLIMVIIETLIAFFAVFILNIPNSDMLHNNYYVFICTIIAKVIESILVFILYKNDINIAWLIDSNSGTSKFSQILVIIASILLLMIGTSIYISSNPQN
ncbi:MAG: sensor histidine kinase, partial [Ruminiclostridium sp.]